LGIADVVVAGAGAGSGAGEDGGFSATAAGSSEFTIGVGEVVGAFAVGGGVTESPLRWRLNSSTATSTISTIGARASSARVFLDMAPPPVGGEDHHTATSMVPLRGERVRHGDISSPLHLGRRL
jgi:hypothetical protein